jgi:hypothetical protein
MEHCARCRHSRDDGEDHRFGYDQGSAHGIAGSIEYFLSCDKDGERVPDKFDDCPMVVQAIKTLPIMCQACESLECCHFPEHGDFICVANLGRIATCYREKFSKIFEPILSAVAHVRR